MLSAHEWMDNRTNNTNNELWVSMNPTDDKYRKISYSQRDVSRLRQCLRFVWLSWCNSYMQPTGSDTTEHAHNSSSTRVSRRAWTRQVSAIRSSEVIWGAQPSRLTLLCVLVCGRFNGCVCVCVLVLSTDMKKRPFGVCVRVYSLKTEIVQRDELC